MATIEVKPIVLRNVLLTLGADGYQKHVSGVTFAPAGSVITFSGLTPDAQFSFPSTITWTCVLNYAQDWETPNSLSRFLFDNEGETIPAVFEPEAGGQGFTANIIVLPGAIGGDVNTVAVGSVTLGVQGRPKLASATP
ncbi:hypothetical protein [Microbacterium resistens]